MFWNGSESDIASDGFIECNLMFTLRNEKEEIKNRLRVFF